MRIQWYCFSVPNGLPVLFRPEIAVLAVAFAFTNPHLAAITYDCVALNVPGAPTGLNNSGMVVGTTGIGVIGVDPNHGFIRDAAGNVTMVDYPGQSLTQLFTINNNGVSVGMWRAIYASDPPRGFFTRDPTGGFTAVTIPAPYGPSSNANATLYGINDTGAVSGRTFLPDVPAFFILNPDGSASPVPNISGVISPESLNNFGQMLESGLAGAALAGPGNTVIPIIWNNPRGNGTFVTGLNNAGTVVGFTQIPQFLHGAVPGPGFVRDPSGTFSGVVCTNLSTLGTLQPNAINDNGVVVGISNWLLYSDSFQPSGFFMATPLPGSAQFNPSVSSLDFGRVAAGQTSAPLTFTISNSGNARLDVADIVALGDQQSCCFTMSAFSASACMKQGTPAVSLNPGESCVVSVTAGPSPIGNGQILVDDSAPGSPHSIRLTATDASCATEVTSQFQVIRGGFRYVQGASEFVQTVTLQQLTQTAIQPPVSVVLDNLSPNATLVSEDGFANGGCISQQGTSYMTTTAPQAVLTLRFLDLSLAGITYNLRILAGGRP